MSRSRKIGIIKERPRNHKKSSFYWRKVRHVINEKVRALKKENIDCGDEYLDEDGLSFIKDNQLEQPTQDELIPSPKQIVDDYDYSDYHYHKTYNKIPK